MNKYIKQMVIVFIVTVVSVIPIIVILGLFKWSNKGQWLIAEWSAGELLGYMGSIIGGIFSVLGVWYTVRASNMQYRENMKNDVKPYLSFANNYHTGDKECAGSKCVTAVLRENGQSNFMFRDFHFEAASNIQSIKKTIYANGAVYREYDQKIRGFIFVMKNIGKGVAKSLYIEHNDRRSMCTELLVDDELKFVVLLRNLEFPHLHYVISYESIYDDKYQI